MRGERGSRDCEIEQRECEGKMTKDSTPSPVSWCGKLYIDVDTTCVVPLTGRYRKRQKSVAYGLHTQEWVTARMQPG